MPSLNKVQIIGNLTKEVESQFLPDGKAVANFSVATNEQWKSADGEKKERTEFHRVTAFGKLAEICAEYCTKGKSVYIEGKLVTRKWQDKSGADRYTTEINADTMLLLGGREGGERASSKPAPKKSSIDEMDDDIGF